MMFGILPGINIPPLISIPIKIALICSGVIDGEISAAASVALSTIAEIVFTQYKSSLFILTIYKSIIGLKPVPSSSNAKIKTNTLKALMNTSFIFSSASTSSVGSPIPLSLFAKNVPINPRAKIAIIISTPINRAR
jgi:hypothetical protein